MAGMVNMRAVPAATRMIHLVFMRMYRGSMLVACFGPDVFVLVRRFIVMRLFTCYG
jgi:hypothetical protein